MTKQIKSLKSEFDQLRDPLDQSLQGIVKEKEAMMREL
jgi:hypothetical protein